MRHGRKLKLAQFLGCPFPLTKGVDPIMPAKYPPFMNPDIVPDEYLKGFSFCIVNEYLDQLDTPYRFKREDLLNFKKGIAFGYYFLDHCIGNAFKGNQQVMMIPETPENYKGKDGEKIPILGFTSKSPLDEGVDVSHIPSGMPDFMAQLDDEVEEIMRPAGYSDYKGEVVAEVNTEKENDYASSLIDLKSDQYRPAKSQNFVPSCYLSYTELSLFEPGYPSMMVSKTKMHSYGGAGTGRLMHDFGDKLKSRLPLSDSKIKFDYGDMNYIKLTMFGEEPPSNRDRKESMFEGLSKHKILGNRVFLAQRSVTTRY